MHSIRYNSLHKMIFNWYFLLFFFCNIFLCISWAQIFLFSWALVILSSFLYTYISPMGLIFYCFVAIMGLVFKSWALFFYFLKSSSSIIIMFGSYALLFDGISINFCLNLDFYSISYITLTVSIGLWAIIFAYNYMRHEPRLFVFVGLLVGFLLSMVLLLASGNLPTLLLGWELIGCTSFLLINFWTTRVGTAKSAFKAFFFNKLSDLCLIVALLINLHYMPSFSLITVPVLMYVEHAQFIVTGFAFNIPETFLLFLIIAAFCKSAQFGAHIWLPDSMEAPVPASALIHSATLVSAGIYLVGRVYPLLANSAGINIFFYWCAFTAFYGGIVAAYQTDLKRILAYSTISHCGLLMCSLCLNNMIITLIYLHFHGWFKSLSFMCAGSIISKNHNYQDFRKMGNMGVTGIADKLTLVLALANLASLPLVIGFFNKHLVLDYLTNGFFSAVPFIWVLGASFTGVFYSFKLLDGVFWGSFKSNFVFKDGLGAIYTAKKTNLLPASTVLFFSLFLVIIVGATHLILGVSYQEASSKVLIENHSWSYLYRVVYFSLVFIFFKNFKALSFLLYLGLFYVL